MRSRFSVPRIAACAAGLLCHAAWAAEPAAPVGWKWEEAIAAFEAADRDAPPRSGGVVFVGSSSIRRWDLRASFPDLPVVNRGFGGSELPDATRAADRILRPHSPRLVVLYSGDNDIARGRSAAAVADDFRAFVAAVRRNCPGAGVACIAVKPCPARWRWFATQTDANRRLATICADTPGLTFIDVVTPMLGPDGMPRPELYAADGLHLSDAGERLWAGLVRPRIEAVLAEPAATSP
jgi:lysophospholipase L1-like esterase